MTCEWSCKSQNSSCWGKFPWNFDQGKGHLVRVSEFPRAGFDCTQNHVAFVGVHVYSYWLNNKPSKVLGGL